MTGKIIRDLNNNIGLSAEVYFRMGYIERGPGFKAYYSNTRHTTILGILGILQ